MIYVDQAKIPASVRNGSKIHTSEWSHLTADTIEELHRFAVKIGLRRSWFQDDGIHPHYDLTAGKRWQAIRNGAQQITWEQSAETARRCATTEPDEAPAARVIKRNYHEYLVRGSCGHTFNRPKGETYEICLACQTAQRLRDAGFTHDDPALTRIRDHNAQATHWTLPSFVRQAAENADRSDRAAAVRGVVTR